MSTIGDFGYVQRHSDHHTSRGEPTEHVGNLEFVIGFRQCENQPVYLFEMIIWYYSNYVKQVEWFSSSPSEVSSTWISSILVRAFWALASIIWRLWSDRQHTIGTNRFDWTRGTLGLFFWLWNSTKSRLSYGHGWILSRTLDLAE